MDDESTNDAILPDFIVKDNIKYINNTYIANNFNIYFSKVVETLDEEIPRTNQYSFNQFLKLPNLNYFFLEQIKENELIRVIENFKPKKSLDIYK